VDAVVQSVDRLPPGECLQGYARFVAPGVLEVDSHTRVEARAVVIATGSSVVIPSELALVRDRLLTTDSIFELPTLPATLAVVGGGTVGVELGQALARLGVRVTLLSRGSTLGPASDPQVQAVLREQLGQELELLLSSRVTGATPLSEGIRLSWEQSGRSMERVFEAVLVASGRRPNVKGLHLEAAGIPLDDQGVPMVDEATLQCGETPVFCAGDANDGRNLLHEASDEGRIAGINAALWPLVKPHPRRTPLSIVFSDPQVALVGLRFQQLEAGRHVIGEARFDDQGRARIMGRNAGVIRVYADQTGRLVGAELVGPRAEHMAHHLAWTIQQGLTVETILGFPFYHPVLEECLRSALQDLAAKVRRQPTRLEPLCG
jgi:dihydrolipoamide dehydrogenase